jgi:TP901 family phage tail tape measure protein
MSVVNIPTSATGYHQSIVSQATTAQKAVNRMQMSPRLNPQGIVQPLGKITNSASEFQKSMDASAARVFAFGAAVGVINGISDAFRGIIQATAEVEKSLKDIQVVMEATDSAMKKFGDGLFDVARNTATSFQLVAESATELARQGLSSEETLARVNSALVLNRLSGLGAVKSTETLTAAINSFNKEGITHEQIVNRMANVDAAFAVSSADLAEAISRAGAVAQESGVQFNELAAIVTAVQQRTARGGSVIGNGFKSIFTRIKRSRVRDALEEIGVSTTNLDGSFRSSIDVLKDYAGVYETLSDSQKSYTSEQIAGVFQIQNLQALISDLNDEYSVYNRALGVANNTTNEATKRNEELNKTLSAVFTQTSLTAKELAASIGEIGFSDNFKEILTFLNNLAGKLNEMLSENKGSELAKGLVRGIGAFLTGPGLVILGAAFIKIFAMVTKFAKEAFSDLLGVNKETKRQQSLQVAISQILSTNAGLYQKIFAAGTSTAKQEQMILNIIKQETAERLKQEAVIKRIAASSSLVGIGASDKGFVPMGKRGAKKTGRKTLNAANGFLPSFNQEKRDINKGVGGAKTSDKPVLLKNHKMGRGRTENVIAHTGEWVINNFGGSGGTAIFNRDMAKQYGLPKEAKKITASGGLIPNFSKKRKDTLTRPSLELGWSPGGRSQISQKSDPFDKFTATVSRIEQDKTADETKGIVKKESGRFLQPYWVNKNNNKQVSSEWSGSNWGGSSYKEISKLPEEERQNFVKKYKIHSENFKQFKAKGYGQLMKTFPYNNSKKYIKDIVDSGGYSGKSQPQELKQKFAALNMNLSGAAGEISGAKYLKKIGYSDIKFIAAGKSFDYTARNKKGDKVLFENKMKEMQNISAYLKKGATEYLGTIAAPGIKDNKPQNINLDLVKSSGSLLFPSGINAVTAKDSKETNSKITHKNLVKDSKLRERLDKELELIWKNPDIKDSVKSEETIRNFLFHNAESKIPRYSSGFVPNFGPRWGRFKKYNKDKSLKDLRKKQADNKQMEEAFYVRSADAAQRFQRFNNKFGVEKIDDLFNVLPFSEGYVPNFMIKKPGFGRSGSVYSMNRGKEKVLNVSHIRAEEGEFGSSIYKNLMKEIESAAKSGQPYTKIDAGSVIGPRIPRALLAAKKMLDKKRLSSNIPKMTLEGVFIPRQLRKRVEGFRQDNYYRESGKFRTKDPAEYLPGEEGKLIKSLRAFGLGRNAHKRKAFVRLEDLPIGKNFSKGYIPNFRNVTLYRGQKQKELDLPNIGKNMPSFDAAKTPQEVIGVIQKFVKSHSTGPLSGYRNMGEVDGKMPSGATSFSTSRKVAENFSNSINIGQPVLPGKIFEKIVPEKNIFSKKKLLKIFNKGANPEKNFYPKVDQFKTAIKSGAVEKWAKKNGGVFLNVAGEYNDKRHLSLAKMDAGRMRSKYGKDMGSIVPEIDVGRTLSGKRDIFRKEKEVMHIMSRGYVPNFSFRGGALKRIATKMHKPAIEDPKGKILYQGKKYREAKFNTPDWDNPNVKWISPVAQRIQGGKQEVEEFAKYLSTRKDIPAYVASNFKKGLEKEKAALEEQKKRHYELGKKIKMGNAGYYERKNHFTTPLPEDNPFRVELKYLKKDKINDLVQGFRNNYSKGFIPNFAAGVKTSRGFFSTQRINRLKGGQAAKDQDGNKVYMNMFSPEDRKKIKGFQATFSKENMAATRQVSRDKKNEMQTIDASRQATMLVATNNLRKRVDTKIKQGKQDIRLKYRVEGLKPSRLKNSEEKIRGRVENLMLKESSFLAQEMAGAGNFGANTPPVTRIANAGSVGSAAGSIFETALKAVGKNKLFTKNNASFDIAGFPDEKLQKLFGYYTPFADAKIGLSPDTKRDFNQKLLKLPSSQAEIGKQDAVKQQAVSRSSRKNFGPLRKSEGFIPNFAIKKWEAQDFINKGLAKNLRDASKRFTSRDHEIMFGGKRFNSSSPGISVKKFGQEKSFDADYQKMKGVRSQDNFIFGPTVNNREERNFQMLLAQTQRMNLEAKQQRIARELSKKQQGIKSRDYKPTTIDKIFKTKSVRFDQINSMGNLTKKQFKLYGGANKDLTTAFHKKQNQLMQLLTNPPEDLDTGFRNGKGYYSPQVEQLEKELKDIKDQRKNLQAKYKNISDKSILNKFRKKFGGERIFVSPRMRRMLSRAAKGFIPKPRKLEGKEYSQFSTSLARYNSRVLKGSGKNNQGDMQSKMLESLDSRKMFKISRRKREETLGNIKQYLNSDIFKMLPQEIKNKVNNYYKKQTKTSGDNEYLRHSKNPSFTGRINNYAGGFVSNFSQPLQQAIAREGVALKERGLPKSSIKVEQSNKLKNNKNPMGLAVTNKFDEPGGLFQGINRANQMGIDPKTHGMSEGYVPNFRMIQKLIPGKYLKDLNRRMHAGKFLKKRGERGNPQSGSGFGQNLAMGGMFAAPMANEMMFGGQEKPLGVGASAASGAMTGAGFGAMFGVPGMIAGAGLGAAHGAISSYSKKDGVEASSRMMEGLKKSKEKLDKIMNDGSAMESFGAGLIELNQAMESGDPKEIVAANKKMRESLMNIADPKLRDKLHEIRSSSVSASEKLKMMGEAINDVKGRAEEFQGLMNAGGKFQEHTQKNAKLGEGAMGAIADTFSATAEGLMNWEWQGGNYAKKRRDRMSGTFTQTEEGEAAAKDTAMSFLNPIMKNNAIEARNLANERIASGAASRSIASDKKLIQDLINSNKRYIEITKERDEISRAQKSGEIGEKEAFQGIQNLNSERIDLDKNYARKRRDVEGFNDSSIASSLMEIYKSGEFNLSQETLKKFEDIADGLDDVSGEISNLKGLSTTEIEVKRREGLVTDASAGVVDRVALQDFNQQEAGLFRSGQFEETEVIQQLKSSGQNAVAVELMKQLENETGVLARAFAKHYEDANKKIATSFSDLSSSMDAANTTLSTRERLDQKTLSMYQKIISAQDRMNSVMGNYANAVSKASGNLENMNDFLMSGIDYLVSTGSMKQREGIQQAAIVQGKTMKASQRIEESQALFEILRSNVNLDSMMNLTRSERRELGETIPNPSTKLGEFKQDTQEMYTGQDSVIAQKFDEFLKVNEDGNITLSEIKGFQAELRTVGKRGNDIADDMSRMSENFAIKAQQQREKMLLQNQLQLATLAKDELAKKGQLVTESDLQFLTANSSAIDIPKAQDFANFGSRGAGPVNTEMLKLLQVTEQVAAILGMQPHEMMGVDKVDYDYQKAQYNQDLMERSLKADTGQLPPGMQEVLDKMAENTKKDYEQAKKFDELIKKSLSTLTDSKSDDPLINLNLQMATLIKDGLKIQEKSELAKEIGLEVAKNLPTGSGTTSGDPPPPEYIPPSGEVTIIGLDQLTTNLQTTSTNLETYTNSISEMTNTMSRLPEVLKTELQSVVLEHNVTGSIDFNFNSDVVRNTLGPVMFEQLKRTIAEPMILDYLARALGPRMDVE